MWGSIHRFDYCVDQSIDWLIEWNVSCLVSDCSVDWLIWLFCSASSDSHASTAFTNRGPNHRGRSTYDGFEEGSPGSLTKIEGKNQSNVSAKAETTNTPPPSSVTISKVRLAEAPSISKAKIEADPGPLLELLQLDRVGGRDLKSFEEKSDRNEKRSQRRSSSSGSDSFLFCFVEDKIR